MVGNSKPINKKLQIQDLDKGFLCQSQFYPHSNGSLENSHDNSFHKLLNSQASNSLSSDNNPDDQDNLRN